jgi:hypothetical protein
METTKQEIQDYLNINNRHSIYSAHLYFDIDITQVYKILYGPNSTENKKITKENKKIFESNFATEHFKEDYIQYQRAEYIEDGFYIKSLMNGYELWEIPEYGGEPSKSGEYTNMNDLIETFKKIR